MKFYRDQRILMMIHHCVIAFVVLGSIGFAETSVLHGCLYKGLQTSKTLSATGWFSIRLAVQNFIGNTLDVPSCRYTLGQADDSSNIL